MFAKVDGSKRFSRLTHQPKNPHHCSILGMCTLSSKKVKSTKATGPDGISPKLVKEFAYELSSPVTDILNSSYKGVVPKQWKQAIVVPIPKTKPPQGR